MDPSALIFIALAVAWAVYLIPKALEHQDQSVRTRTVERFSAGMRVLARREPVSRRRARLVPTRSSSPRPGAGAGAGAEQTAPGSSAAPVATPDVRRAVTPRSSARAAARRVRVLTVILLSVFVVAVFAAFDVIGWRWVATPVVVLLAWLVACRLMVRRERAGSVSPSTRSTRPGAADGASRAGDSFARPDEERAHALEVDPSADVPTSAANTASAAPATGALSDDRPDPTDPRSWDPVPVTLPTYVSKPVAPRSVRTIDLDSTGVWTSGRSESDSELVREDEAAQDTARQAAERTARRRRA